MGWSWLDFTDRSQNDSQWLLYFRIFIESEPSWNITGSICNNAQAMGSIAAWHKMWLLCKYESFAQYYLLKRCQCSQAFMGKYTLIHAFKIFYSKTNFTTEQYQTKFEYVIFSATWFNHYVLMSVLVGFWPAYTDELTSSHGMPCQIASPRMLLHRYFLP